MYIISVVFALCYGKVVAIPGNTAPPYPYRSIDVRFVLGNHAVLELCEMISVSTGFRQGIAILVGSGL